MGYRANVITREREYGSSIFVDWQQFSEYFSKIQDIYADREIFTNEAGDHYEIDRGIVKEEIKRLYTLGEEEDFEFQPTWKDDHATINKDVIMSWETALRESPEDTGYVSLEWY